MSLLSWRRSADTYAVLGPRLTTADEVANPNPLDLVLQVNGEVRQQANTREQVYNVDKPISWASEKYPLDPRGITLTGTPEGVGYLQPDARRQFPEHLDPRILARPGQQDAVVSMARQHMQVQVRHSLPAGRLVGLQDGHARRCEGCL